MTDSQRDNLDRSRKMAAGLEPRPIRCPRCNMRLLDVFDREHHLVSAKCPKCKASLFLDTALFRTRRPMKRNTLGSYSRGWEPSPFLPTLGPYSR